MNTKVSASQISTPQSKVKRRVETLREQIEVERCVADVYRYLLDFSTIEQWDPGVYRARKLDSGVAAAGTQFEVILNLPNGRQAMTYQLIEAKANKRLVLRGRAEGFSAVDTIELTAIGNTGTRIEYTAELTFAGWRTMLMPAMRPLLDQIGRKAVQGMQQALTVEPRIEHKAKKRLGERLLLPAALDFTERGYLKQTSKGLSERMDGCTVVVTGPSSGLGLATACECARLGARVALVGRDNSKMRMARKQIQDFSGCSSNNLPLYIADLSLLQEVRRVAQEILQREPRIDVLVNNAGALFATREETAEGHERSLAINLLAPWVLTQELFPKLQSSAARVINVASGGLYLQAMRLDDMQYKNATYDGSKAYARAKRGLVYATEYLASQHPRVSFNAMHPGWAATPGVSRALPEFEKLVGRRLRDSRMGADTIVWLASSSSLAGVSGKFWFDREPRKTALLPGTAASELDRRQLLEWLHQQTQ